MIEENIKINPQPEEFDDSAELEPVTFVTEDGGEENFWHIMTFPYEGAKYAALVPEDQIEELATNSANTIPSRAMLTFPSKTKFCLKNFSKSLPSFLMTNPRNPRMTLGFDSGRISNDFLRRFNRG